MPFDPIKTDTHKIFIPQMPYGVVKLTIPNCCHECPTPHFCLHSRKMDLGHIWGEKTQGSRHYILYVENLLFLVLADQPYSPLFSFPT